MNTIEAIQKLRDVVRRKHFSLSTEQTYCGWLNRYCEYLGKFPVDGVSEKKMEAFLTYLAKAGVSASTQNQAFNAVLFFYRDVLGQKLADVQALRAKRPVQLRHAPETSQVQALLKTVSQSSDFAVSLVVRLLYGCGLRVTEPMNLRLRDVHLEDGKFLIRAAKGGKDRVVPIPCSCIADIQEQIETAKAIWRKDQLSRIPVALPNLLAKKYPHFQFNLSWEWLFPANGTCEDPRTGQIVRWRLHEANIQRAVRSACRKLKLNILPHELRHAYATHCLNAGRNPRAIQEVMGHKSLETTMGYLHSEPMSVPSPLDTLVTP